MSDLVQRLRLSSNDDDSLPSLAADEIERLQARYRRLQSELSEVKKAGTPYAAERDAINGLILENQRLQSEMDALQSLDGINWHEHAEKQDIDAQRGVVADVRMG